MDLPPPDCLPEDRRRVVAGQQAAGVVAGTVAVVATVLLVLDLVLPTWSRGFLLLLGPALAAAALSRYRLPLRERALLGAVAAAYVGVLLLTVG
jgi:hypothetical protein